MGPWSTCCDTSPHGEHGSQRNMDVSPQKVRHQKGLRLVRGNSGSWERVERPGPGSDSLPKFYTQLSVHRGWDRRGISALRKALPGTLGWDLPTDVHRSKEEGSGKQACQGDERLSQA